MVKVLARGIVATLLVAVTSFADAAPEATQAPPANSSAGSSTGAPKMSSSSATATSSGAKMSQVVSGEFDVKVIPQTAEPAGGETIGRMLLDKKFHGPLDATSKGQMLAMMTAVKGSAGYVAMELVTGKLDGRSGSFALQHSGTMNRGAQHLVLTVVPDSGTGELTGLTGSMDIIIEKGKHSYRFTYALLDVK